MKPHTLEWVEKAEGDFAILESLQRSRSPRILDGICFHAQQCVEKYLKARLDAAGQPVPPIHHLPTLLDRVLPWEPLWEAYRAEMILLGNYGDGRWDDLQADARLGFVIEYPPAKGKNTASGSLKKTQ